MSQWNYFKLEIDILDSFLRQWNFFEEFNVLIFIEILLKYAIVFNIFDYFCLFLSLTIITGQRSFSSIADGLLDITPEIKNNFEQLHSEMFLNVFKLSVFYLIYLLTRLEN